VSFGYPGQALVFEEFSWRVSAGRVGGHRASERQEYPALSAGRVRHHSGHRAGSGRPVPRPRASTGLILQDYGLLP